MTITIKSDLTGKVYSGEDAQALVKQCEKDDAEFKKAKEQEKAVEEKKSAEVSKAKKELSKSVEAANDKLVEARKNYEEIKKLAASKVDAVNQTVRKMLDDAEEAHAAVKEKARQLLKDSDKEVEELLKPAKQAIKDAEHEKYQYMIEFADKFGPYQVTYTGEKAKKEYEALRKELDDMFKDAFKFNDVFDMFPKWMRF